MLICDTQGVSEDLGLDDKSERAKRLRSGAIRASHLASELLLAAGKLQELIATAVMTEDITFVDEE